MEKQRHDSEKTGGPEGELSPIPEGEKIGDAARRMLRKPKPDGGWKRGTPDAEHGTEDRKPPMEHLTNDSEWNASRAVRGASSRHL